MKIYTIIGREIAIRHINNWIGYHGEIVNIRWGIMPPEALKNYGYEVPSSPYAIRFLDVLPDRAGSCLHHGLAVQRQAAHIAQRQHQRESQYAQKHQAVEAEETLAPKHQHIGQVQKPQHQGRLHGI